MHFNPGDFWNKKRILYLFVFTIAVISVIFAAASINRDIISTPQISVEGADISGISPEKTNIDVILIINNKNFFGGTVKNLSFDIVWNNENQTTLIARGKKDQIEIKGNQKTRVAVPLEFYNKNIIPLAADSIAKGSMNMTIRGNADLELFFLKFNVPFDENRIIETDLSSIISGILKFIN